MKMNVNNKQSRFSTHYATCHFLWSDIQSNLFLVCIFGILHSDICELLQCEQSLQALKKISQEHPTACLRAGALMAVLSYLDFFSTGVQVIYFLCLFCDCFSVDEECIFLLGIFIYCFYVSACGIINCSKYVQETSFRCI